jgi:Sulfatase
LHGFEEDFEYLNFSDCFLLMAAYSVAAIVLCLLFQLCYKNFTKAALLTAYLMAFYLFFGALHDFLGNHSIPHRYGLAFSGFVICGILLLLWLNKRQHFRVLVFFLNVLFVIYLVFDTGSIIRKALSTGPSLFSSYSIPGTGKACDTCRRPDIYFLIFDEYSSSDVLKDVYHYDNSGLDSFLAGEGFSIQRKSRANYNMTPFSVASLLNLSYLSGIPDRGNLSLEDYKKINLSVRHSALSGFLSSSGYTIINYSPFDLRGHPSVQRQPFLLSGTRLITNGTLPHYFEDELNWVIGKWLAGRHLIDAARVSQPYFNQIRENNARILNLAKEESRKQADRPRFVYVHLFLPHRPYVYDSLDRPRNTNAEGMNDSTIREYLGYLPFTNACARDLVSTIKNNTGGKAVILFMSDHGFKFNPNDLMPANAFYNQNAVYLPDRDYRLWYDSISGVNQFRVLLNKLFRQNLPLLKDSVLFLHDKQ